MKTINILIFCGLWFFITSQVLAVEPFNPHQPDPNIDNAKCQQCHQQEVRFFDKSKFKNKPMLFKQDQISMCIFCHEDNGSSHSVDISVDFPVPADLLLSASGKITCLTCHHTHGQLKSNRAWASVSFIDKFLNSERLRKTYLLRRNNANGELCLVCHDPEVQK